MATKERIADFKLGDVRITSNATAKICGDDIFTSFVRYTAGDWGEMFDEDRQANDEALGTGSPILAMYTDRHGLKFLILTEGDRSATTIMLPEDY